MSKTLIYQQRVSKFSPRVCEIKQKLDTSKPLILLHFPFVNILIYCFYKEINLIKIIIIIYIGIIIIKIKKNQKKSWTLGQNFLNR